MIAKIFTLKTCQCKTFRERERERESKKEKERENITVLRWLMKKLQKYKTVSV